MDERGGWGFGDGNRVEGLRVLDLGWNEWGGGKQELSVLICFLGDAKVLGGL